MALLPCDSAVTVLYVCFGAPSHNFDAFIQRRRVCCDVEVPVSRPARENFEALDFFVGRFVRLGHTSVALSAEIYDDDDIHPSHRPPHPPHNMSAPASRALRRCICAARPAMGARPAVGGAQQRIQRRWQSDAAAAPANPKIATIVDQISQLTLLETADLVSTLKVRPRGGEVEQGWRSVGWAPCWCSAGLQQLTVDPMLLCAVRDSAEVLDTA